MQAPLDTNGGGEASWKDSYKTAQMISLPDVTRICGNQAGQLVQDLARGVGCPEEYILMPLLSCCSALMGKRAEIRVHGAWSEPPVLWMVVGAATGSRKSAALRQVLSPLVALASDKEKDPEVAVLSLPWAYTGSLDLRDLREALQDTAGIVLHVTERLELAHAGLHMDPLQASRSHPAPPALHDLYEGLAGNLAGRGFNFKGDVRSASRAPLLSPAVSYNQCGFARPEYVVNLVVKGPSWLSGRFLVSCPAVDPHSATSACTFSSLPCDDEGDNDDDDDDEDDDEDYVLGSAPPRAKRRKLEKRLSLKDVYFHIARAHSQKRARGYKFTKRAVQQLRRFQEEEWRTIVTQLGGGEGEDGGAVGKSLGQIVRLAGVLKALKEASASGARFKPQSVVPPLKPPSSSSSSNAAVVVTGQQEKDVVMTDSVRVADVDPKGRLETESVRKKSDVTDTEENAAVGACFKSSANAGNGEVTHADAASPLKLPDSGTGGGGGGVDWKPSETGGDCDRDAVVLIDSEDVLGAVELGKYFLEQKLSMTFMVATGFFRRPGATAAASAGGTTADGGPGRQPGTPSSSTTPSPSTPQSVGGGGGDFSFMPPPPADLAFLTFPKPQPGAFHAQPPGSGVVAALGGGGGGGGGSSSALQEHHLPHLLPPNHPGHNLGPRQSQTNPFFGLGGGSGVGGAPQFGSSPMGGGGSGSVGVGGAMRFYPHLPPPTSSSSAPSSSSSAPFHNSPTPEIDVSQLGATWIPTSPEEEMAEMSQAADFAQLESTQFVQVHARRVKRLLECFDDGCGVSATTAAQKSIAPPVRVAGTNNRHPAWASALFFQKVADLGLGLAEQVRHPTNGRVYWRFRRKTIQALSERNFQLLQYLRIDMVRYSRLGHTTMAGHNANLGHTTMAGHDGNLGHTTMAAHNANLAILGGGGDEISNSGSKGNTSPLEIKQEVID